MRRRGGQERRQNLNLLVTGLFAEANFYRSFKGVRGQYVTAVERKRIPLLWSKTAKTALAKGFCSNMGDTKYACVCRKTQLPRRDAHGEKEKHAGDESEKL